MVGEALEDPGFASLKVEYGASLGCGVGVIPGQEQPPCSSSLSSQ